MSDRPEGDKLPVGRLEHDVPDVSYPVLPSRRRRNRQPGIISTGPLVGCPKRPTTDHIRALSLEQIRELTNAFAFADAIGRPLNASLAVTWPLSALFTENEWPRLQTKLFDYIQKHLRRRGIVTAFVWTRERQTGKGPHTHALLHVGGRPPAVRNDLLTYLNRKLGFEPDGLWLDIAKFGLGTEKMRAGHLRYMVKGLDHGMFRYNGTETENVGHLLGIEHRGTQGIINIKRAGASENISAAARKRAGWSEMREIEHLARVLNPIDGRPGMMLAA